MREEEHRGYYDSILRGKSFIDIRLSIQTAVQDFLVQTFFGKDFNRVVYTNPEYAFRKRIEVLSNGIENENIFINNLQLPFCNYWLSSSPKIEKTAAASEWNGYYDDSIGFDMHFYNTLQNCKVQFYFDRSDDATVAFEIAQTESLAGTPIYYQQEVLWRNKPLKIPIFIKIKDIKVGNEEFDESAWLENNHLFAMTMELEIECARLHIHRGLNAVQLPFKWHNAENLDTWKDGDQEYYAQKCILIWSEKVLGFDNKVSDDTVDNNEELDETVKLLQDKELEPIDKPTLKQIQSFVPNNATVDMVRGFFQEGVRIDFNRLSYNAAKTTIDEKGEVSAWIDIVVKPATYKYWDYTDIYIPSREEGKITIKNCKDKYVIVDGLHPNSQYTAYLIAHDINGNYNTIPLTFTTPIWKKETLPNVSNKDPKPEELTTTIENKKQDDFTIIHGKGLIGLEL